MPHKVLKTSKKYQGRAFDVAKVDVQLPNGKEKAYDLVQHGDSVTIVPVDGEGRLHFVIQYRMGSGDELLELPAGVLNKGETPLACAEREIREEIGLAAGKMQRLGGFYLAPGYTDEFMTVFLATELYDSPLTPDADEFLNVKTLSVKEAYNEAQAGDFNDGKTLAALLLAQPFIHNGS